MQRECPTTFPQIGNRDNAHRIPIQVVGECRRLERATAAKQVSVSPVDYVAREVERATHRASGAGSCKNCASGVWEAGLTTESGAWREVILVDIPAPYHLHMQYMYAKHFASVPIGYCAIYIHCKEQVRQDVVRDGAVQPEVLQKACALDVVRNIVRHRYELRGCRTSNITADE